MCGIYGIIDKSEIRLDDFTLGLKTLDKRGPDNNGYKLIKPNLIFGHTRLSIIDIDKKSNQPFSNDENYWLTFNGEIYNYKELKEELVSLGYKFKTQSDTEVLLNSYKHWGETCVNHFNGMWSFALYDVKKEKLFCSRDRFGIKPFYYTFVNGVFIFSSNIKAILAYQPNLKVPNFEALDEYILRGNTGSSEMTWFKNIKRLQPSNNLIFHEGSLKTINYYTLNFKKTKDDFNSAKINFKNLLFDAVKLRLRSDVKIASTLTTGTDSSSITVIAAKNQIIETFTVFSKNNAFSKSDKKSYKKGVDLDESSVKSFFSNSNIKINLIENKTENFIKNLQECIFELESGNTSQSMINALQLYKNLKGKTKVLLEGQGADEILYGYINQIIHFSILNDLRRLKFIKAIRTLWNFNKNYSFSMIIKLLINNMINNKYMGIVKSYYFGYDKLVFGINRRIKKSINHKNYIAKQIKVTLPNLLQYGDALSMSQSIETRFPFLDYKLVNYINSLPLDYKINGDTTKYILRGAMLDELPQEIVNSKIKIGFSTPTDSIMRENKEAKQILYTDSFETYFNQAELNLFLDKFFKNEKTNHNIIFRILSIKIWHMLFLSKKI